MQANCIQQQVIEREETRARIEKQICRLKEDFNLLYAAMNSLSSREREVVQQYHNSSIGQLSNSYHNEILYSAMEKLGAFLQEQRGDRTADAQLQYKQQLVKAL